MSEPELTDVRVLVTGGAGFIGSHLVDALVERGAKVRVLDNLVTGRRENLVHRQAEVELVEDDIRELRACLAATDGVRYVFHQAALGSVPRSLEDPATSLAVNLQGTANVLTAAHQAGAARVVLASSSSVYGDSERLPKREGEEGAPLSPYAGSKRLAEQLAELFGRCFGLEWIGLRYFNVYGERQDPAGPYAAVIPRFFKACLAGDPPTIYGDGEQSRDFTFVGDAVRANLLAAGAPGSACGQAYNVAAGRRTTVNELARRVVELIGGDAPPRHLRPRPGDVRHSLADLTRVREALGYEPQTDLDSGLAIAAGYYRALFESGQA